MHPQVINQHIHSFNKILIRPHFVISSLFFFLGLLPAHTAFGQQVNKIQQMIDAIKEANYCEDQDYHTDGQRTVWVKSYKKWTPEDLTVMKKEAPDILVFLTKAIQHKRYDVLEQLLPEYYHDRGGVKAFADDIIKAAQ